jgi:PAS domain S-box-containing protein
MNQQVHPSERRQQSFAAESRRAVGAQIADWLAPRTAEEHARRRAHLAALLLIAAVATIKHVTGLTEGSASYTVYAIAIAVSALIGGVAPAMVATMAAVLLADAFARAQIGAVERLIFAAEGMAVAVLVAGVRGRLRTADAERIALHAENHDLRGHVRRGRLDGDALQHVEAMAPDAAVFIVNAHGLIVEWPKSAERLYGYTAEEILGASLATIAGDSAPTGGQDWSIAVDAEQPRRTAVHVRSDGARVHVAVEVRRCRPELFDLFTVAVQDLSTERQTDAFRDAAVRAQAALQKAADDARAQLEVLESLTDPSVNPVAGPAVVGELLERLRASTGADGVALVQLGRTGSHVIAGAGLRPAPLRTHGVVAAGGGSDGRVALVHNDAARVAQVSAVTWSDAVSSLMVVPVCDTGEAAFKIELVYERRAPATEWDLALARIVADRLAQAVARQLTAASADAVA